MREGEGAPVAPSEVAEMSDRGANASMTGAAEKNRVMAENLLTLVENLAKTRANPVLVQHTSAMTDMVRCRLPENCAKCTHEIRQQAIEDFFIPKVPRHEKCRRSDFLLRLLVAQFSDALTNEGGPWTAPALPRWTLNGLAGFLERKLGVFAYGELNADAQKLLTMYPDESDTNLREMLFERPEARVVTVKVLFNALQGITDMKEARDLFKDHLSGTCRGRRFVATDEHFQFVYDRLFNRVMDFMQQPARAQEIERYFGYGATERLLRIYDAYSHMLGGH